MIQISAYQYILDQCIQAFAQNTSQPKTQNLREACAGSVRGAGTG